MIPIALVRSCFCIGIRSSFVLFCFVLFCFFLLREITGHSGRALVPEKGQWSFRLVPPCIRPDGQRSRMSTVGLGFIIEVVSSRSGVWCADIICICITDSTSPRPAGKTSMHAQFHLEKCTTSEVRACGRKGISYSRTMGGLGVSGFRRIHLATGPYGKLGDIYNFGARATEVGFFPHGRDLS